MTKIFISYRRDDSADIAGRIYDRLVKPLGPFDPENVFKDVNSIPLGVNFKKHLENAVSQCAVQPVVIGPKWLEVTDEGGQRRLDNPADFVRIEIETALSRDIPVIPLLVQGASMPSVSRLPSSLAELAYRNGTPVRRDPDFHTDMIRVIASVDRWLTLTPKLEWPPAPPKYVQLNVEELLDSIMKTSRNRSSTTSTVKTSFALPMLSWCHVSAGSVEIDHKTFRTDTFLIGKYPVTNAQFQVFIDDPEGYEEELWWEYSRFAKQWHEEQPEPHLIEHPGDKYPRSLVSWYEAMAFCQWLSFKSEQTVTLPTEQQWQRAAQGNSTRRFPWGDDFDISKCNTKESGIEKPTEVDRYPNGESQFGVGDMSGNVWEWCLTEYESGSSNIETSHGRAVRGGCWKSNHTGAYINSRHWAKPDKRISVAGFRLVVS